MGSSPTWVKSTSTIKFHSTDVIVNNTAQMTPYPKISEEKKYMVQEINRCNKIYNSDKLNLAAFRGPLLCMLAHTWIG